MNPNSICQLTLRSCAGALVAFTSVVWSATYRCEQDWGVVYSDIRCGPSAQQSSEVQNSYPGGLRPGEQRLLNEATPHNSSPSSAVGGQSDGYGDRIRQQNQQRKLEGDRRRIPSKASSPWH